jgi:hypothetical protein
MCAAALLGSGLLGRLPVGLGGRHDGDVNRGLVSWWDGEVVAADRLDVACRVPAHCWMPPNLGDLVRAVRETTLCRLFPFTSHASLCLSDRPDFWQGGPDGGQIAPAFVSRTREDGYLVWSGSLAHVEEAEAVLTTGNAEAAAAELERFLAWWPSR